MYHRRLAFVVLIFGLGLAGAAAFQARSAIDAAYASTTVVQEVPTRDVLAFAHDLPRGHQITTSDFVTVEYVETSVPPSVFGDIPTDLWLARDVVAGQPVLAPDVSSEPVARRPQFVTIRRGIEQSRVCVAHCEEDAS